MCKLLTTLRLWATQFFEGDTATGEEGHEWHIAQSAAPRRHIDAHLYLRQNCRQMRWRREAILERESGEHLGYVACQHLWQSVDPRLEDAPKPLAITAEPTRLRSWWAAGRHACVTLLVQAFDGFGAHSQQGADRGRPLSTLGQDVHLTSKSLAHVSASCVCR
jgi:hypothetical protein